MALTANREVDRYVDQELRAVPVKASARIYKGALVGLSAGYARPLAAGDGLAGVAYEEADNSAGTDGAASVRVFTRGDFEHALTGAGVANNGAVVYASADDTLTLTSSGNSLVGRQVQVAGSNRIVLRLRSIYEQ